MKQTVSKNSTRGVWVCFLAYMGLLIYYLLFAERGYSASGYNIVPFEEIKRYLTYRETLGFKLVALNLGGNILGFSPLGFLLPVVSVKHRRAFRTILFCFLFSLLIEMIQMMTHVGCFDVDDIILNTAGGVVGYLLYVLVKHIRRAGHATTGEKEKTS